MQLLADGSVPGASFFSHKVEADTGTLPKFFMTIVVDLAARKPATASHLEDILDADDLITTKYARGQCDKLLL